MARRRALTVRWTTAGGCRAPDRGRPRRDVSRVGRWAVARSGGDGWVARATQRGEKAVDGRGVRHDRAHRPIDAGKRRVDRAAKESVPVRDGEDIRGHLQRRTRHEERRRRHSRTPVVSNSSSSSSIVSASTLVERPVRVISCSWSVERCVQLARRDDGVMDEAGVGPRCSEETGGEIERPRALRCAERRGCDLDLDGRERRALQGGPRSGEHTRHTGDTSPLCETAISARTRREQILLRAAP